ncbi:hypothetical protein N9O79_02500 [Luminiphilus sp.]|nr:hypothetical protein [Luminiphilus sp.]
MAGLVKSAGLSLTCLSQIRLDMFGVIFSGKQYSGRVNEPLAIMALFVSSISITPENHMVQNIRVASLSVLFAVSEVHKPSSMLLDIKSAKLGIADKEAAVNTAAIKFLK